MPGPSPKTVEMGRDTLVEAPRKFETQKTVSFVKPKALDLFCGTKSVTRALETLGFEVFPLDNRPSTKPSFCTDILGWSYKETFEPSTFQLIFASLPCTELSTALTTRERDLVLAEKLIMKTLEIIEFFQPKEYFIENPASSLLKDMECMAGIPRIRVDYCQVEPAWGYQKPTMIFGTVENLQNVQCDFENCAALKPGQKRHKVRLGGNSYGVTRSQKYRVPGKLLVYLCGEKVVKKPVSHTKKIVKSNLGVLSPQGSSTRSDIDQQESCHSNSALSKWRKRQKWTLLSGGWSGSPDDQVSQQQSTVDVPKLKLMPRILQQFCISDVEKAQTFGKELQLLLRVQVTSSDGGKKNLLALVDTGAQVNLFRMGLFDADFLVRAKNPVRLVAVNGAALLGGENEITLDVGLLAHAISGKQKPWHVESSFLEANIKVDLILSYPWLKKNRLGVLPHENALCVGSGTVQLLRSWQTQEERELYEPNTHESGFTDEQTISTVHVEMEGEIKSAEIEKIKKLRLRVPNGNGFRDTLLTEAECVEVVRSLGGSSDELLVGRVITTDSDASEWGENQPLVDELRAKLLKDFGGTVLRTEVLTDPPIRGPNCEAKIYLKPGAQPKKQKGILLQGERADAMRDIASEWLQHKKTESGFGPWSSPAFPVKKKSNKWRGVVDLRWVNSQCMDDAYPLPRISDILVKMGRKKIFSLMDLKDAFHQIPLNPESRPITATSTPLGM